MAKIFHIKEQFIPVVAIFAVLVLLVVKAIIGLFSADEGLSTLTCSMNAKPNRSFFVYNSDTTINEIDKAILHVLKSEGLKGGATVAISKEGRVVYARGFGFSCNEDSIDMEPYNRMRVASVSKLITAIAVIRLVEEGRIGLHQKVFGPMGVLNDDKYLAYKDKRMGDVTVYQLLNHSGGWTSRYGDPMFMAHSIARQMGKPLPISMEDIIRFMQVKSMHFKPGSGSSYSNFGYGILGEVVAKASGMPYEDYVRSELLAPIGVYDMQIGYSRLSERLPDEVVYYESDTSHVALDYTGAPEMVRRAYGGSDIQTLGSAGGWVANAIDLLKLTLTVDGLSSVPDQLSQVSIDTMTHRAIGFDPIGWRTTLGDKWYRSGTLSATSAMIGRHPDGINYVLLLNCCNYRGPVLATSLRSVMDRAISSVKSWPDVDLLSEDEQWQYYINTTPKH